MGMFVGEDRQLWKSVPSPTRSSIRAIMIGQPRGRIIWDGTRDTAAQVLRLRVLDGGRWRPSDHQRSATKAGSPIAAHDLTSIRWRNAGREREFA